MPPMVPRRGGLVSTAGPDIPGVAGKTVVGKLDMRHRKIVRDSIKGVTKPAIRRLARRGGVKRISGPIYEETREVLKRRLTDILKLCCIYVEYRNAKTITIHDVLHSLRHLGTPIYGFDPDIPINNVSNSGSRFPDALEHQ